MIQETPPITTLNADPKALRDRLTSRGGIKVSFFLPIASEPPESDKNVSRLKNLISKSKEQLKENGMEDEAASELLGPIIQLCEHPRQLLRGTDSIALLVDEAAASIVELPYRVEDQVMVGNRFTIKPIVPLLQSDVSYYAICLNRNDVRAYRGSRFEIEAIEIPDMPQQMTDVTGIDDPEKSIQHHTAKTGPKQGEPGSAPVEQVHGHNVSSDMEKTQHERFLRDVAKAVHKFMANIEAPLVVFGVDENVGLFSSLADWSKHNLRSEQHDPHTWSATEVRRHAVDLLEPECEARVQAQIEKLQEAHNKDTGIFDTGKCAIAAANGRVEMACVASDKTEPGICEPEKMKVSFVEGEAANCAHDLLDTIAFETIAHGGEVYALPAEKIPGQGQVGATVRY